MDCKEFAKARAQKVLERRRAAEAALREAAEAEQESQGENAVPKDGGSKKKDKKEKKDKAKAKKKEAKAAAKAAKEQMIQVKTCDFCKQTSEA